MRDQNSLSVSTPTGGIYWTKEYISLEDVRMPVWPLCFEDHKKNKYAIALLFAVDMNAKRYFATVTMRNEATLHVDIVSSDTSIRSAFLELGQKYFYQIEQYLEKSLGFSPTDARALRLFGVSIEPDMYQKILTHGQDKYRQSIDSQIPCLPQQSDIEDSQCDDKKQNHPSAFAAVSQKNKLQFNLFVKQIPNGKPTMLILYRGYFIGMCNTIHVDGIEYMTVTAIITDSEQQTWIIKPQDCNLVGAKLEELKNRSNKLFLQERTQLMISNQLGFQAITPSDSIKSEIYVITISRFFDEIVKGEISQRYSGEIASHEALAKKIAEEKLIAAQTGFNLACNALRELIEKYKKDELAPLSDEAIDALNEKKIICEQCILEIPGAARKIAQQQYEKLKDLVQEFITRGLFLSLEKLKSSKRQVKKTNKSVSEASVGSKDQLLLASEKLPSENDSVSSVAVVCNLAEPAKSMGDEFTAVSEAQKHDEDSVVKYKRKIEIRDQEIERLRAELIKIKQALRIERQEHQSQKNKNLVLSRYESEVLKLRSTLQHVTDTSSVTALKARKIIDDKQLEMVTLRAQLQSAENSASEVSVERDELKKQLETLREQQRVLNESFETRLQALRVYQDRELTLARTRQSEIEQQLVNLEELLGQEREAMRLERIQFVNQTNDLHAQYQGAFTAALHQAFNMMIQPVQQNHVQEIQTLQQNHEAALQDLRDQHAREVHRVRSENTASAQRRGQAHAREVSGLREEIALKNRIMSLQRFKAAASWHHQNSLREEIGQLTRDKKRLENELAAEKQFRMSRRDPYSIPQSGLFSANNSAGKVGPSALVRAFLEP